MNLTPTTPKILSKQVVFFRNVLFPSFDCWKFFFRFTKSSLWEDLMTSSLFIFICIISVAPQTWGLIPHCMHPSSLPVCTKEVGEHISQCWSLEQVPWAETPVVLPQAKARKSSRVTRSPSTVQRVTNIDCHLLTNGDSYSLWTVSGFLALVS